MASVMQITAQRQRLNVHPVHLERKETSEILVHFREGDRLEGLGMIFAMVARRQPDSGC